MAQMHADAAREASARGDRHWSESSLKAIDEALNLATSSVGISVESARLEAGESPAQLIAVDVGGFVASFLGNQRGTFDVGRFTWKSRTTRKRWSIYRAPGALPGQPDLECPEVFGRG